MDYNVDSNSIYDYNNIIDDFYDGRKQSKDRILKRIGFGELIARSLKRLTGQPVLTERQDVGLVGGVIGDLLSFFAGNVVRYSQLVCSLIIFLQLYFPFLF